MFRRDLSTPDDRVRERMLASHWNGLDATDQLLELRRYAPAESLGSILRCEVCGRDVRAQECCPACGDETDVERTGDGCTREIHGAPGERHDGVAIPARPLSARSDEADVAA